MTKYELNRKTDSTMVETRDALQIVYDTLNQGQQKKIVKDTRVKVLFDRYGVMYDV